MLIIGCGNLHRGDDAAGLAAAERLCARGIKAELCVGGFSQLIDMWTGADDVVVIDTVLTGSPAGTLHVWDGRFPIPAERTASCAHGVGIADAIELARRIGRLPERLHVYGIEGRTFELGAPLSPEVERGIADVVSRIAKEAKREKAS